MMNHVIQMTDVTWRRDGKEILKDINWHVKRGEHWAVLGLNGSGKTTLLNMVNGYIWPSTGEVEVLGCRFGKTDIQALRKRIGWVSSSLQQRIQRLTDAQDIVVSGKYASIGMYDLPTEQDFQEAFQLMEDLGVKHLIGRTYETCSQGEKQKLLIARGLMAKPELLILDEPTNGLDFLSREELMETIAKLAQKENAPTIIFVTHHIDEILPVFTHTLLIRAGQVFASGQHETILESKKLSEFFGKSVEVNRHHNRAWLRLLDEEK